MTWQIRTAQVDGRMFLRMLDICEYGAMSAACAATPDRPENAGGHAEMLFGP
jgi:hypothetical protein